MKYNTKSGMFTLWTRSYAKVGCPMRYRLYPFDTQICRFQMISSRKNMKYLVKNSIEEEAANSRLPVGHIQMPSHRKFAMFMEPHTNLPSNKTYSLNVSTCNAEPTLNVPSLSGGLILSEYVFPHFCALEFPAGRHLNVSSGKKGVYGTASWWVN